LYLTIEEHEGAVWYVSVKDKKLYSGSSDRSVFVWDIESGLLLTKYEKLDLFLYQVVVLPDSILAPAFTGLLKQFKFDGTVVRTLNSENQQYCLVVDENFIYSGKAVCIALVGMAI
jgi:WD40 repeat protein